MADRRELLSFLISFKWVGSENKHLEAYECCYEVPTRCIATICLVEPCGYFSEFFDLCEVIHYQMPPLVDLYIIITLDLWLALGGVTAVAPPSSRSYNSQSVSNALSASSVSNETPVIDGATPFISCACPGSSRNQTRLLSASTNATIFFVSPPLERPMA